MLEVDTEHVLVVPTQKFHDLGYFQGFCPHVNRYLPSLLEGDDISYRPRSEMERDPSFKQLIPYVIFRHSHPDGSVSVFRYTRGSGQGEGRLHSKQSVGIGGHISSQDSQNATGSDVYELGLRRELEEEVSIETPYQEQCVGLINDDETEVGRVHLGVVHIFDVQQPKVFPREDDIADAGFQLVAELLDDLEGFETWSKISLQSIFGSSS